MHHDDCTHHGVIILNTKFSIITPCTHEYFNWWLNDDFEDILDTLEIIIIILDFLKKIENDFEEVTHNIHII